MAYGIALAIDTVYGVPAIHHGGHMIGFHSDMIWLPEQQVGAVVLTNGDPGWLIRYSTAVRRPTRRSRRRRRLSSPTDRARASC